MESYEDLAFARRGQRAIEPGQFRGAEAPVRFPGYAAVEHDDAPVPQVMVAAHRKGRLLKFTEHDLGIVMIARQAPYGLAQIAHQFAHRSIAARIIVN